MSSSQALSIIEEVVHTWEKRAPEVSAGPISLAIIVFVGSFVVAWIARAFLLGLYALIRYLNGYDVRTTWWWYYLCCCSPKKRHHHHKRKKKPVRLGEVKVGTKELVGGSSQDNRRTRRKRNPFRNIYHLFVLCVGLGIIAGGVVWALHIVEAPLSLLVSLGIVGYIFGQAAGPTIGNVICGIIIYAYDLVEIGEFISLPDGRKGYVESLTPFWTIVDDPQDDCTMDRRIFINNRDIIAGFNQHPFHQGMDKFD